MSNYNAGTAAQQPAAICALKSPADAIYILEAVRMGLVPRVTRRLTGHERTSIRPGTVWVWEEEETNMKRWTDGRRWGASRVGNGGFLVYTESSESHSPPPHQATNPYNGNYFQPPHKSESLVKQTYSTSMAHPSGKQKRFHVVAYSSKYNPQGDANNPLPLPHQLPALADRVQIQPGNWPEWEQQRSTTEAYARRPPPGVTLSPTEATNGHHTMLAAQQIDTTPINNAYPGRLPSPPAMRDVMQTPAQNVYATPAYLPRDQYDRRTPQYSQQGYPAERYHPYYDARQDTRPSYPTTDASPHTGGIPSSEPWAGAARRDRSPPARDPAASNYLQTPYPYYPRDRYPDTAPAYVPYGQQIDYRSPEFRTYEAIDTKPNMLLSTPANMPRLPPTPNSAAPDLPLNGGNLGHTTGTGPSPKLSISNNLLNPSLDSGLPNGNVNVNANGSGAGLTLPPLRMTLDDGSANGINGRKSPNGDVFPKEDARQLDGLGRRAY